MAGDQFPRLNATKCVNGIAEAISGDPLHTFKCKNVSDPNICGVFFQLIILPDGLVGLYKP
jgi:hypothetical protein